MKRRNFLAAGLAWPAVPLAGLAGLPGVSEANEANRVYAEPDPSRPLVLPRDHGAHPDFRTEWWYFTGWFDSPQSDKPVGVQITFFRSAPPIDMKNPSAFAPRQLLFAHAAVALPQEGHLKHAQIIRRAGTGGIGFAPTDQEVMNLRMPGWTLRTTNGDQWHCRIDTPQLSLELTMSQTQLPWFQGENGYSRKGPQPAQSSHYITLPHMASEGVVRLDGKTWRLRGSFWMDHEWSSTLLAPNAQGWDWVGLHGEGGEALMAFRIRNRNPGEPPVWTHAALRRPNGEVRQFDQVHFNPSRIWQSPRTGISYPVAQKLVLDDLVFTLEPLMNDQELDARDSTGTLYWEGAVRVETSAGTPWGQGYLEMTGYDRPMQL